MTLFGSGTQHEDSFTNLSHCQIASTIQCLLLINSSSKKPPSEKKTCPNDSQIFRSSLNLSLNFFMREREGEREGERGRALHIN